MHTFQTPMTSNQRYAFMVAVGKDYAGHGGGQFNHYADARTAFDKAGKWMYYKAVGFTDADFPAFKAGYDAMKAMFHDAWKVKADAQNIVKTILADCGYNAANYVYDKDQPTPYLYGLPCKVCDKLHADCDCKQGFKPTKNPAFGWD